MASDASPFTGDDRSCMKTETVISDDRLTKTVIEYGLHRIGDQSPYFSLTADRYEREHARRRWPKEPVSGGAMHEEIIAVAPHLAPFVELHLADEHGTPLYAIENGWYWFDVDDETLARTPSMKDKTPAERAATYLHVEPELFEHVTTKDDFLDVVKSLEPRFAERARVAIETFALSIPGHDES